MQRQLKFRGFVDDISGKGMFYGHGCFTDQASKTYLLTDTDRIKVAHLMEWTGLLDKNGKEIYEGDVFKNVLGSIRVVAHDDGGFRLVKDRFFKTVAGDAFALGDMNRLEADNGEVIGNIYENPELLNV